MAHSREWIIIEDTDEEEELSFPMMVGDPYYPVTPTTFHPIPSDDGAPLPSNEWEESEPMEESESMEETESVASSLPPLNTLYRKVPGGVKMKRTARKSIPIWQKLKKSQKATSSGSHRVQDEPARIAQTVDKWVAEEKAAKMYETGQSSRPHLPHSSEDNTLSQLFEKSVKIEDKMEIVEGRATHLSGRVRRLEGQRTRDQESVMDVHHRINFAYNDMITHDARIAELELYNQTSRNEEHTGSLEQRTQALEEQVVNVTDVLGHHLGFW